MNINKDTDIRKQNALVICKNKDKELKIELLKLIKMILQEMTKSDLLLFPFEKVKEKSDFRYFLLFIIFCSYIIKLYFIIFLNSFIFIFFVFFIVIFSGIFIY
jgi:hypothetical protein